MKHTMWLMAALTGLIGGCCCDVGGCAPGELDTTEVREKIGEKVREKAREVSRANLGDTTEGRFTIAGLGRGAFLTPGSTASLTVRRGQILAGGPMEVRGLRVESSAPEVLEVASIDEPRAQVSLRAGRPGSATLTIEARPLGPRQPTMTDTLPVVVTEVAEVAFLGDQCWESGVVAGQRALVRYRASAPGGVAFVNELDNIPVVPEPPAAAKLLGPDPGASTREHHARALFEVSADANTVTWRAAGEGAGASGPFPVFAPGEINGLALLNEENGELYEPMKLDLSGEERYRLRLVPTRDGMPLCSVVVKGHILIDDDTMGCGYYSEEEVRDRDTEMGRAFVSFSKQKGLPCKMVFDLEDVAGMVVEPIEITFKTKGIASGGDLFD